MNNPNNKSRVLILDIAQVLAEFTRLLTIYTMGRQVVQIERIFVDTLRFLHHAHCKNEAVEALMFEIADKYFPDIEKNSTLVEHVDLLCRGFIDAVYKKLLEAQLYDGNDQLAYTIGGWASPFSPYLVKTADLKKFSNAVPLLIQSQYDIPRDYSDNIDNPGYWNPAKYLTAGPKY